MNYKKREELMNKAGTEIDRLRLKNVCIDIRKKHTNRDILTHVVEELSELQTAICKSIRQEADDDNVKDVVEEIADVLLGIKLTMSIYNIETDTIKRMINVKLSEQERINQIIHVGVHSFEIVDAVPKGYTIWKIGKNMPDGYLPLCKLYSGSKNTDIGCVDTTSLKAVKCEGAQVILAAAVYGEDTLPTMEDYIRVNMNSTDPFIKEQIKRIKKAIPFMKEIKFEEGDTT